MRKFAENKQTNRQSENTQSENSKTEATLIPCGSWGGAGQYQSILSHINSIAEYNYIAKYWRKIQSNNNYFSVTNHNSCKVTTHSDKTGCFITL